MDVTVRNGLVVTAADMYRADIGINGEKVVSISACLSPGEIDVDAAGRWVVPGFLDVHTHFDVFLDPFQLQSPDDFQSGTRQAAGGGVTTVVDYAFQTPGESLHAAVEEWQRKARGRCHIDYGFHCVITDPRREVLAEIEDMVRDGVPSFKVFMVHGYGDLSDLQLYGILRQVREAGGVVNVHAENGDVLAGLTEELQAKGHTQPRYIPSAMPAMVEGEATRRIVALAALANDAPVYIVHLSAIEALEAVREARERGQHVFAETRPLYLVMDESIYRESPERAIKYTASPPPRSTHHQQVLWTALRNGELQIVASDHTAWNFKDGKDRGIDDFTQAPPGIPAVETMGPLLFTFGVKRGRISPNKWVEVLATNPAKLFGLYPRKGSITVGGDADLVLYDPDRRVTLSTEVTHGATDYEPYDGTALEGYPVLTMSRGTIIMEEGQIIGRPGHGQWMARKPFQGLWG